jgi:hypothetical protein
VIKDLSTPLLDAAREQFAAYRTGIDEIICTADRVDVTDRTDDEIICWLEAGTLPSHARVYRPDEDRSAE